MSASPYNFDAPGGDVVFRAPLQPGSDEFKAFHAHKAILSIASSVFEDTFSIPQPPTGDAAPHIIQIVESAEVFDTFLRLIYPIEPPVINSLQLVDDLFRLAEKYVANGVRAKLKQILVSPSFLRDAPILVYAIACRTSLDEETKLAIPHTFKIDLVRDMPRAQLRMMASEAYHDLLVEHSRRRDQLVDAIRVASGGGVMCGCVGKLRKEIRLEISTRPFLDRETLERCLSALPHNHHHECRGNCTLSPTHSHIFLSKVIRVIETGWVPEEVEY